MSFLENLRQQHPPADNTPQLIYLLAVDPLTDLAQLHLFLCEMGNSPSKDSAKPYFIQKQHLQHPPEFISQLDREILTTLVDTDNSWNQQSNGNILNSNTWEFLKKLSDTDRFYGEENSKQWNLLGIESPCEISLQWEINAAGDQHLTWNTSNSAQKVFFISTESLCTPLLYSNTGIAKPTLTLTEKAEQLIADNSRIAAWEVDYFLLKKSDAWLEESLPLPRELPTQTINAKLVPILSCVTVHAPSEAYSQRDELQLSFGLETDTFCLNLSECDDTEIWDGENLSSLSFDKKQQKEVHQSLADTLTEFSARQQVGEDLPLIWYSRLANHWQWLFTEAREELKKLNIHFNIMPKFRKHYVMADEWKVHLDELADDSVEIEIQVTVENRKYNLKELLIQIHELNQKVTLAKNKTHQQFELNDGRILLMPMKQFSGIMEELGDLLTHNDGQFKLSRYESHRLAGLHQHLPENADWQGDTTKLNQAIDLHDSPVFLENSLEKVNAELRPYQWLGVCWMQHITQRGINGLLADDMGLGKTLQTLAHLSFEHQQNRLHDPALIIVPTSLLHNWAREVEKFTPHLSHIIIHGSQRHQWWGNLDEYDIIISSYPLIANDLEKWQTQKLSWIILDEAQTIKNPRTRVSQAVREIPAAKRCAFQVRRLRII